MKDEAERIDDAMREEAALTRVRDEAYFSNYPWEGSRAAFDSAVAYALRVGAARDDIERVAVDAGWRAAVFQPQQRSRR